MNIYLRPQEDRDYPLTMAWRSHPLVYEGSYSQVEPLEWEEHTNWIRSRNRDWHAFIIMYDNRPVGILNFTQLDHWEPEIGVYIGEVSLWGKGVGKEAVRLGLEYIKAQGKESCHTTILESNERALRLFKSLGFKEICEPRKGEVWVKVKL